MAGEWRQNLAGDPYGTHWHSTQAAPLARQAKPSELACRDMEPDSRDNRWREHRFACAAVRNHAGDHVPWGAADSEEGLRELTWPNR